MYIVAYMRYSKGIDRNQRGIGKQKGPKMGAKEDRAKAAKAPAKAKAKKAPAKKKTGTPTNPLKTATVVFTTSLKPAEVTEYFNGKKIEVTGKGPKFTAKYKAHGAAKNDVAKRLEAMCRKTDGATFEIVEYSSENHDIKK